MMIHTDEKDEMRILCLQYVYIKWLLQITRPVFSNAARIQMQIVDAAYRFLFLSKRLRTFRSASTESWYGVTGWCMDCAVKVALTHQHEPDTDLAFAMCVLTWASSLRCLGKDGKSFALQRMDHKPLTSAVLSVHLVAIDIIFSCILYNHFFIFVVNLMQAPPPHRFSGGGGRGWCFHIKNAAFDSVACGQLPSANDATMLVHAKIKVRVTSISASPRICYNAVKRGRGGGVDATKMWYGKCR